MFHGRERVRQWIRDLEGKRSEKKYETHIIRSLHFIVYFIQALFVNFVQFITCEYKTDIAHRVTHTFGGAVCLYNIQLFCASFFFFILLALRSQCNFRSTFIIKKKIWSLYAKRDAVMCLPLQKFSMHMSTHDKRRKRKINSF